MGYSKSRVTLNRRLKLYPSFFESLQNGRPARLVGKENEADILAFKIREALFIAHLHPSHYPELARAYGHFVIEILDTSTIQARSKEGSTEGEAAERGASTQVPTPGRPEAPQVVTGLRSATQIISHCIRAFPTNDPLHFPDADLDETDLTKVYRWCRTLAPPRVIIKPKGTNAITIANKPGKGHPLSHAIWRPADAMKEEL